MEEILAEKKPCECLYIEKEDLCEGKRSLIFPFISTGYVQDPFISVLNSSQGIGLAK